MQRRALLALTLTLTFALAASAQNPAAMPVSRPSLDRLIAEAKAATPPALPGGKLPVDLVEVTALDPTIRLDIRYATPDNFLHVPVYQEARAFLQRPVAEALARVNRGLRAKGYALRIHDAYRPWWVTKVFWEATAVADRAYVADPAQGSVHNRGCAVDLDLVALADGAPASMPGGYDEMSERSHLDYGGGPAEARQHRDLLRAAMEAEGFRGLKEEWWHFDHASSSGYPVLNLPFEAIRDASAQFQASGQVLLVTSADWRAERGSLQRFERRQDALVPVGAPLPVWLGSGGLGWRSDEGAPPPPATGPLKAEGDGRSPAGILTLGEMYGYAPNAPEGVRFTYHASTRCDRCVDDGEDADYGRVVHLAAPDAPVTWHSAEHLRLDTEHYRYLVVIHYNDLKPRKGAGSCIFLHVAPPPGGTTAGCTALAADDLLTVLRWLDPARQPLLVQLPTGVLATAGAAWNLPLALRSPAN